MTEYTPIHFYDEPIAVFFESPPAREKTPDCPDGFAWNSQAYRVLKTLSEWSDFTRRGKYARNMRPAHAAAASTRGSLNVGRFYFRVRVAFVGSPSSSTAGGTEGSATAGETKFISNWTAGESGGTEYRIFDIYYDRAMKNVDERKGQWFIYRELAVV
jgi:hypothetical protein